MCECVGVGIIAGVGGCMCVCVCRCRVRTYKGVCRQALSQLCAYPAEDT